MAAAPARRPPPPAPRPAPRRARRWPWAVAGLALAVAAGVVGGVVVGQRLETGRWKLPRLDDVIDVVVPEPAAAVVEPRPPPVARTIYLEKGKVTLTPGFDDAARGQSSVVAFHHPGGPVTLPGWKGTAASWKKLVACVQKMFAPFDVTVTDQPPAAEELVLVAVGGRPKDLGLGSKKVSGLAPFNGQVIPRPVVFAFAAQLGHAVQPTCETIAMEVAHAYGLDHGYLCKDVMTYLTGCGAKSFVDKDVPCGEHKKRPCHGGAPTQNSYRHLLEVLGPRKPAP